MERYVNSSDKATGTLYDIDVTADVDPDVSIDWDWWDTTIDISISVKFSISGKFDLQILKETLPQKNSLFFDLKMSGIILIIDSKDA